MSKKQKKWSLWYSIPINEEMVYVRESCDYGKTVSVERFNVFWCKPIGKKPHFRCNAEILMDGFISTSCDLDELVPIGLSKEDFYKDDE